MIKREKHGENGRQICLPREVECGCGTDAKILTKGAVEDIAEREDAEKETQLNNLEWEHTFDSVSDLIFILDTDFTIKRINPGTARKLSLDPRKVVGRNRFEFTHQSQEPPEYCPNRKLLLDSCEHSVETKLDLFERWFDISVSPLLGMHGELIGSLHLARDITAHKQAEDQVRKSLKETEHMNRVMLGREIRIVELKQEINSLCRELVRPEPVPTISMNDTVNSRAATDSDPELERYGASAETSVDLWDLIDRQLMQQLLDSFCEVLT